MWSMRIVSWNIHPLAMQIRPVGQHHISRNLNEEVTSRPDVDVLRTSTSGLLPSSVLDILYSPSLP